MDSQRSLPVFDAGPRGLSALAKKLRFTAEQNVAAVNALDGCLTRLPPGPASIATTDLPATPWRTQRDVLGELTAETGYRPVALVPVDETWTAMRFKPAAR